MWQLHYEALSHGLPHLIPHKRPPGEWVGVLLFPSMLIWGRWWRGEGWKPEGLSPEPTGPVPSGGADCRLHPGPAAHHCEHQPLPARSPHFSFLSKAKLVRKGESQWGELSTLKLSHDFIFKSLWLLLNKLQHAARLSGSGRVGKRGEQGWWEAHPLAGWWSAFLRSQFQSPSPCCAEELSNQHRKCSHCPAPY